MKKAMIDYMKNIKNDELYTPEYAIKPLLKYLPRNLKIWECTDFGNSNITKVFENAGYYVISTNKEEIDFLNDKANFEVSIMSQLILILILLLLIHRIH